MITNRFRYFIPFSEDSENIGAIMFIRYDNITRECVYFLKNSGDTISCPYTIYELEKLVTVTKKWFEAEVRIFNSYPDDDPHPIFVLKFNSGIIKVLYFTNISRIKEYTFLSTCAIKTFLEKELKIYTEIDINEEIRLEKLYLFIHRLNPLKQLMVSEERLSFVKKLYDLEGPSLSKEFNEVSLGYIVIDDAIINNTFIQMYL